MSLKGATSIIINNKLLRVHSTNGGCCHVQRLGVDSRFSMPLLEESVLLFLTP